MKIIDNRLTTDNGQRIHPVLLNLFDGRQLKTSEAATFWKFNGLEHYTELAAVETASREILDKGNFSGIAMTSGAIPTNKWILPTVWMPAKSVSQYTFPNPRFKDAIRAQVQLMARKYLNNPFYKPYLLGISLSDEVFWRMRYWKPTAQEIVDKHAYFYDTVVTAIRNVFGKDVLLFSNKYAGGRVLSHYWDSLSTAGRHSIKNDLSKIDVIQLNWYPSKEATREELNKEYAEIWRTRDFFGKPVALAETGFLEHRTAKAELLLHGHFKQRYKKSDIYPDVNSKRKLQAFERLITMADYADTIFFGWHSAFDHAGFSDKYLAWGFYNPVTQTVRTKELTRIRNHIDYYVTNI